MWSGGAGWTGRTRAGLGSWSVGGGARRGTREVSGSDAADSGVGIRRPRLSQAQPKHSQPPDAAGVPADDPSFRDGGAPTFERVGGFW